MREQKPYYGALDLARLYCALLIVVIHMGFGNSLSLVPCLTRQGVPFFFLASGFFFSKKLRNSNNIQKTTIHYIKPLLIVFVFWNLVWAPSIVSEYSGLYTGTPLKMIAVLFRRIFVAGIAPYWFLLVLAEGTLLLALIIRYRKYILGMVLCVSGIVLSILYSYQAKYDSTGLVYRVFYSVFSWNNNVIMSGFPLLYLGALFDMSEERLQNSCFWMVLPPYAISIFAAFLVYRMDEDLFFIPFGVIQAILLFHLCVVPVPFLQHLPEKICKSARDLSSVIFLTHTVFLTIIGKVFHLWDSLLRYGITVLCAIFLFLLARKLDYAVLNALLLMKHHSFRGG